MNELARPELRSTPKYFFLLDIFRGFAALSVVMYHWEKFYVTTDEALASFNHSHQPLYSIFYLFYDAGDVAVDLFFLISGFVFFYLYSKKIAEGGISAGSFFTLRFSRLYPLHFATLLLVLVAQLFVHSNTGAYIIYFYNDAYHFILNLFLVNSWGLEKGASFNGPNWSISVEVLLYLLFFVLCIYRLNKKYIVCLLVFLGLVIQLFYSPIGRGMFSFFLGGCVYYYYLYIQKHNKAVLYLRVVSVITFVLVLLMILNAKYDWLTNYWSAYMIKHHYSFKSDFLIAKILNLCVRAFVLPSLLLFTVLLETVKGAIGKRLAFIGHISYSSYLIHFPLQMIVIYCAAKWGIASSLFNSPLVLAGFFIVLITLSLMSYYYFELPVQNYIRKRLLKKAGQNKVTNG